MTKLAVSTELMTNYLQAQIMRPEIGMQALQAADGRAIIVSIGTDGVLYATIEQPGSTSGWARCNLSQAVTGSTDAICASFAVAQATHADGDAPLSVRNIDIAMVIRQGETDRLYLSLGNSAADLAWTDKAVWKPLPFDDPNHPGPNRIAGVFISDATDKEYIVVDVIRPGSAAKVIFRYYIDPAKSDGAAWQPHDVAGDIEAESYRSCLGRQGAEVWGVDGLYTSGRIKNETQLIYSPLFNGADPEIAASTSRLKLPDPAEVTAIAACRNPDNTSDLYVAAGGALYYFAAGNQDDLAVGSRVMRHSLLNGVQDLFAEVVDDDRVMVWARNRAKQIFYTTCKRGELANPASWSAPLPIMSGVVQVSPFVNRKYSANCFFAHRDDGKSLVKAVKSPNSLFWTFGDIHLAPPSAKQRALSFSSYTTRVQVSDDIGQPARDADKLTKTVAIKASNLTAVYINHRYTVVGPDPIEVETDPAGVLTIIERPDTLTSTRFTIAADNATVSVNPMDEPFKRLAKKDAGDLRIATIRNIDGSERKLIASDVPRPDLDLVATAGRHALQAYQQLPDAADAKAPVTADKSREIHDIGDFIAWLGDQVGQGIKAGIQFFADAANKVWTAVVELAGETYRAVLRVVDDVVAFATWLYNKVNVAVKDVLNFLSFVFDVNDMRRSKDVFKTTIKLFLKHQAAEIGVLRGQFDTKMNEVSAQLASWAGLDQSQWATLGPMAASAIASQSASSDPKYQNSASGLFAHHYQGNVGKWSPAGPAAAPVATPSMFDVLLQAIDSEKAVVENAIDRIKQIAVDAPKLSVVDILKKLVAVIADFGLGTVKTVVDAALDLLRLLVEKAIEALDEPIYIPILSDILESFGVPKFSFLDIVCWIAAAPATIIYKLVRQTSPFPDNALTTAMINAETFGHLMAFFQVSAMNPAALQGARPAGSAVSGLNDLANDIVAKAGGYYDDAKRWISNAPDAVAEWFRTAQKSREMRIFFEACQCVAGIMTVVPGAQLDALEAGLPAFGSAFSKPSTVVGIVAAALSAVANAVCPYHPLRQIVFSWLNRVTTGLTILSAILFAIGARTLGSSYGAVEKTEQMRKAGAILDAVLMIPALACSVMHFVELGQRPVSGERSIAIVYETSNITGYLARVCRTGAVLSSENPTISVWFIGGLLGTTMCTGGLRIAAAFVNP